LATTAVELIVFSIVVDGGRWQFSSSQSARPPEVLNERTYRSVDADTIAASDGHNTVTLDYQRNGETLAFDVVAWAGDQSSRSVPQLNAVYQTAPFTRA
jgi:hypothetical protein